MSDEAKLHALIADDNPSVRQLVGEILTTYETSFDTAVNGREAIALLETTVFDLVFLDLFMPEADGYEVLLWIAAQKRAVPVFMMSGGTKWGDDTEDFLKLGEGLGARGSFAKPITPAKIREAIELVRAGKAAA